MRAMAPVLYIPSSFLSLQKEGGVANVMIDRVEAHR